ncbi:hypothetical protein TNCV_4296291 [Trichonephila clavipes]|nr:hypothetical protein TNCV_4296291 [Trichonephila clavipes]
MCVCGRRFVPNGASKIAEHPPQCDLLRLIPRLMTVRLLRPKILPVPQDSRRQLGLRKCQRGCKALLWCTDRGSRLMDPPSWSSDVSWGLENFEGLLSLPPVY